MKSPSLAVPMTTWASQVALVVKNPPANPRDIRDVGSIPGSERALGEGNGSPFQYSCLENPMDRGARQLTVMGSRGVEHYWSNLACTHTCTYSGFPGGVSGKEPDCQCRRHKRCGFDPCIRKVPWRRKWQPTPISLPGKPRGQRSLLATVHRFGKESDMT